MAGPSLRAYVRPVMDSYTGSKIVQSRQNEVRAASEREYLAREHLLWRRIARLAAASFARTRVGLHLPVVTDPAQEPTRG